MNPTQTRTAGRYWACRPDGKEIQDNDTRVILARTAEEAAEVYFRRMMSTGDIRVTLMIANGWTVVERTVEVKYQVKSAL